MKTPNGQFSLWESEKLIGFGICYMTFLCAFSMSSVQSREYAIVERCINFNSFPSKHGLQSFPPLLEEKYLYLVPAFITGITKKLNQGSMFLVAELLRN